MTNAKIKSAREHNVPAVRVDPMAKVIALAGRRIDPAEAADLHFPLAHAPEVRKQMYHLFVAKQAWALVCSAACGADLLALDTAESLGLRCRVILPFERRRFRDTSVTDRPGEWGPVFDRVITAAAARGDLLVLEAAENDDAGYAAATDAILGEALRLAGVSGDAGGVSVDEILAVVVWDGVSRGDKDLTARFAAGARGRGLSVEEIRTL